MNIGFFMIDVGGQTLDVDDIEVLRNPMVGGVILFARNYANKAQIRSLCSEIRQACERPMLIAVDQEGGRVQRLTEPFTRIPPMAKLGQLYDTDPDAAIELAFDTGRLLAMELTDVGIDFSFTPVLDLDYGVSEVIGDRAFHRDPSIVSALAISLIDGLRAGGIAAVAKHYPGHGAVSVDSHIGLPVDNRLVAEIDKADILPFQALINAGVGGIMPAHVIYENADARAAGFSEYWLQTRLRNQMAFDGVIFSDDLSMQAAHIEGNVVERAKAAAKAGCDMLLICNDRAAVEQVLSSYEDTTDTETRRRRLLAMQAAKSIETDQVKSRQMVSEQLANLG